MKVIFTNTKLEFETATPKFYPEFENQGYLATDASALEMYGLYNQYGYATLPIQIDDYSKIVINALSLNNTAWVVAFFSGKPFDDFSQTKTEINNGIKAAFLKDISLKGVGSNTNIEISLAEKKTAGAKYVMLSCYEEPTAQPAYLQ